MAEAEARNEQTVAEETRSPEAGQTTQQQQQQQRAGAPQVIVDDSQAHSAYANFARVMATPEEVIIDFGLNPQPFAPGPQNVKVAQRLIMNFYTAKRLLAALQMTIQRHEAAFGPVELDIRRRANTQR